MIEWRIGEKIEIHGLAMPEMQRNRGIAIEHEFGGDFGQLAPKPLLRFRQYIEARRETVGHAISI